MTSARRRSRFTGGLAALAAGLVFAAASAAPVTIVLWESFGGAVRPAYPVDRLAALALAHAGVAVLALLPAGFGGVALGVAVTRPWGQPLRPLVDTALAALQSVPPVVVVALAFPILGFGMAPTVLALVAYCIMPVLRGTVAAIEATPPAAREAARAMGLTPGQTLWQVEAPLALPVIAEAFRVALVLAIATAAVGALAGAATLGTPIIIGLQNQNELYVLQGAAASAALAFLADGLVLLAIALAWRGRPAPPPIERPTA